MSSDIRRPRPLWKSARLGLLILLGLAIYAYGFQVVKVDLEEFRRESRAESRVRVTRALARPDLFEFDREEFIAAVPIRVPCLPDAESLPEVDTSGQYLVITPACHSPGRVITVQGFNFVPGAEGPISFIPSSDPDYELALQLTKVQVDPDGNFQATVELPERPSGDVQYIRATVRRNIGTPRWSRMALLTWEKIVETVFLALLATTVGTALALPVSFMAARNLMRDVRSPLTSIALSVIGLPIGIAGSYALLLWVSGIAESLTSSLALNVGGLALSPVVIWGTLRWAMPQSDVGRQRTLLRLARVLGLVVAGLAGVLALYLSSTLAISVGESLLESLGPSLQFIANFIFQLGDILKTVIPAIAALAGGVVMSNVLGRSGQLLAERLQSSASRLLNLILAAVAGGLLFGLIGAAIRWLYATGNPATVWAPAAIGALLGTLVAIRSDPKQALPIGNAIYYVTRTILNAVRSIEPLIMAIVAVIWVGIGPFAGVLALALHTIAALGKLYSEQVESILPGPIEAVTATGANRLQMIIYAVVPQIVPPYISFTMYRWDINVRMSTIIGFAGGGGIGFLLQQNINLLDYRGASAQMLAIAIVVASMDYISSVIRERVV